mgnify:CR=1 FL=1
MNAVEVLFSAGKPNDGILTLTLQDAKAVSQKSALRADRDGDNFYDLLSAMQKSIRGSDPDAACHYLARLLEAGQMQAACRRLMVTACEDIGLAYPQIIPIVKACVDAALMLGVPEARIPLVDAAVLMASSLNLPANVKAITADCPFSSPFDIINTISKLHCRIKDSEYKILDLRISLFMF